MRKVVINVCYGGFSLSDEARQDYRKRSGKDFWDYDAERDDPILVSIVEEYGESADGNCAQLKVVEIPDDVEWEIDEYDGFEHIAEKHRTWR